MPKAFKKVDKAVSENVKNAMEGAMNQAMADEGNAAEIVTDDASAQVPIDAKTGQLELPELEGFLVFPDNDTTRRIMVQAANSNQWFTMNSIAWAAGAALTGFGEDLTREKFGQMLKINTSYTKYFTDGSSVSTDEGGVDGPKTDHEGHVDLREEEQMDGGTDKKKRLNAGAWNILRDNIDRFEECTVEKHVFDKAKVVPTQSLKDERVQKPDGSFETQDGVVTKVIAAYNIKQAENLRKWREKQGEAAEVTAIAGDALADSLSSEYDI